MAALLNWVVFAGAIMYGRRLDRKKDPGHYGATWDLIWRMQWENKYPPQARR